MKITYPMMPFSVLTAAVDGNPEAINQIVKHYGGFTAKRSLRSMKDEYGNQHMVVDEEVASVVREIFRLCVNGFGPTRIANILTERKILCPTCYALEKGEKPRTVLPLDKYRWSATVVSHILERMDYLGHTVNFKTHIKSYKNRKKIMNSPDQWKIFENTHEAIIERETFEIVQKIRSGKRRPTRMGKCLCSPACSTVRTVEAK